jgi:5-methylcytosine-specific restriction endonuclease McrA
MQHPEVYLTKEWQRLRKKVLAMDRHECMECKAKGYYTKANNVHHVHTIDERPDLAFSVHDERGERNLVSLCERCHKKIHERPRKLLSEEQW